MNLELLFRQYEEKSIHGRYITLDSIEPLLQKLNTDNQLQIIGKSVLGKSIYSYQIGEGKTKIFLWSQMHGNEGTTTKALFDFLNVLHSGSELAHQLLNTFTFCSIPMLNPDGATLYTRENANKVDLNRDSLELTQPESKLLRETFELFKPDYCFNLHDQRTIFGVSDTGKPATLSFLAPSYNKEREVNESRLKAIHLIASVNELLQQYLPNQIARFDDSFNINCIGDTFQNLGVPTVLFEAGHFQDDYEREVTRKYVFMALILSFNTLSENVIVSNGINKYLNIPQNKVVFYDFMYKNIKINYDGIEIITNFAAQYKEELIENQICFNAYVVHIGDLENYFGHFEYDAEGALYRDDLEDIPKLNQKADFYLNNNIKVVNGMIKI
ncbi:Zinc carboxypeptidase [Flavobacterium fryxellicola]|uniref:Peptidase M14 n=1 Tax=Flavobacterium fryxellicola TaxID=249352 RepID=A0A162P067_9FLAO|nr:M14 metallopeptidase family protein [Flavobacterium fryxellicola]OAB26410.1 peptidase M14 [Flavobacterium fryxellicola]SHN79325.1 Zinc carboxypeptidase [Flavobacterium fryxellicola]